MVIGYHTKANFILKYT